MEEMCSTARLLCRSGWLQFVFISGGNSQSASILCNSLAWPQKMNCQDNVRQPKMDNEYQCWEKHSFESIALQATIYFTHWKLNYRKDTVGRNLG